MINSTSILLNTPNWIRPFNDLTLLFETHRGLRFRFRQRFRKKSHLKVTMSLEVDEVRLRVAALP